MTTKTEEAKALLQRAERNIRKDLLKEVSAKKLAEVIEEARLDRSAFYTNDGGKLTFAERQGILAILTIRTALSMLPPPRAIVLPDDAEKATIAHESFMAGLMYGFAFPGRLREQEESLVKHGLKFHKKGTARKRRPDELEEVLCRIIAKFQKRARRFPSIGEVWAALEEAAAVPGGTIEEVDGDVVTWVDTKSVAKHTSMKTIKGRLTRLRRQINEID